MCNKNRYFVYWTFITFLLPGFLWSQWLETTILVPDSLVGINEAIAISGNPATNKIYIGGWGECLLVVDGATNQKIARIPLYGTVTSIGCNTGRNKIYVCQQDYGIHVIDGNTNQFLKFIPYGPTTLFVHYNPINDKMYFFDEGWNGSIIVVDCSSDSVVKTIAAGVGFADACFNPNNNRFYCATKFNNNILVYDCATDSIIKWLELGESNFITYCAPGNKVYCGITYLPHVAVIDCNDDSLIKTIALNGGFAFGSYNPGTNKLYCSNWVTNSVYVIDCDDDTLATTITASSPRTLASNATWNRVYCTTQNSQMIIIDSWTDSIISTIPIDNERNRALYNNPVLNTIYCLDNHHTIVPVIDCATNSVVADINLGSGPDFLALCGNSEKIYSINSLSRNITAINAVTNQVIKDYCLLGVFSDAQYCTNENKLYCADYLNDRIFVIDCGIDSVVAMLTGITKPISLEYNYQDSKIYCACYNEVPPGIIDSLWIIDACADTVIAIMPIGNRPADLCYDDNTSLIYCALYDDAVIKAIDGVTNQVVTTIPIPGSWPSVLAFNPAHNKLYAADQRNTFLVIIDCRNNQVIARLDVGYYPDCVIYHPNNNMIYCGSYASMITVISGLNDSIVTVIPVPGGLTAMISGTAFNRLYCTRIACDSVSIINCETNTIIRNIQVGRCPQGLAFAPQYNRIYVANLYSSSISVIRDGYNIEENTAHGPPPAFRRITPNPALKFIFVHASGVKEIRVYDAAGRYVMKTKIASAEAKTKLDLSDLRAGVYFLAAISEQKTYIQKVVLID